MADKLEQLGSAHESFSELLHAIDPLVLIGIVCAAVGIPVPTIVEVRYRNPRIEIPGLVKRARKPIVDLVYTTLAADGTTQVWILEVELSWDAEKVVTWAFYELALGADAARLAVFSPEPQLRGDIRSRILPRIKTKPVLLEPDQFERIVDYQEACRRPELAVLGCLFHAQPPAPLKAQVEVFRAAWMAIQSLAERKAQRYSVAVMSIVPEAVVEQGVAELRASGELDEDRWELFSDSERKGHSFARGHREGLAEGLAKARDSERQGHSFARGHREGLAEGLAKARETLRGVVLDVLELRGFAVSDAVRERVESCESIEQLERWYAAAKAASGETIDQLLDD